jgi:hypothetical protein
MKLFWPEKDDSTAHLNSIIEERNQKAEARREKAGARREYVRVYYQKHADEDRMNYRKMLRKDCDALDTHPLIVKLG